MAGVLTVTVRLLGVITAVLLFVTFQPGLPPHGSYEVLESDPPLPRVGPLAPNTALDGVTRLFEGSIDGPEAFVARGANELFTGTNDGYIVKIFGQNMDKMETVVRIGKECNQWEPHICGRPLGLRFGRDGKLLVADSFLGIFKVDVDTGEKARLLDSSLPAGGAVPRFINDLDEDKVGNIYYSVSSTVADMSRSMLEFLAGPSGRLLKYDPKTGVSTVLIDKLMGANGVQLSPAEDFVLVCECFRNKVYRYWLKGPKAGTHDVFVQGLPGAPDNIRARPDGGYDLPLALVEDSTGKNTLMTVLQRLPWLRRLLSRIVFGAGALFDAIARHSDHLANVLNNMSSPTAGLEAVTGNRSMVLQLDAAGNVVSSLQGNTGAVRYIAHLHQVGDKIFLGSFANKYIGVTTTAEIAARKRKDQSPDGQRVGKEEL